MTGRAPALSCEGLTLRHGRGAARRTVLEDAGFHAEDGGVAFVLGPSGCGKSTLLSLLAGIARPDAGRVSLYDADITALSRRAMVAFRRRHIGVVPQQFALLAPLTAAENVALPLRLTGVSVSESRRRATAALDRLGLGDAAGMRPGRLSVGQRQRVAIARAVVHRPRAVLCDEPTAALDPETAHHAMALLRAECAAPGRVVVVVTHDASLITPHDAVWRIAHGRLRRDAPATPAAERAPEPTPEPTNEEAAA